MPDLLNTWQSLKQQADNSDADSLERISRAYVPGAVRVEKQVLALTEQMTALEQAKKLTPAAVKKTAAYTNVITTIEDELNTYEAYLRTEMTVAATQSAQQGLAAGRALLLAAIAEAMGVAVKDLPKDIINQVAADALDFLKEYLRPDGVLFSKIKYLSEYYAKSIAEDMLGGVAQGWNPKKIAGWLNDAYGMPLTDALRMMRTTQLYSYRQANNATQVANSDVLQGVVWCADIASDRTCMSCIALHGEVFDVGTICDDHHNGRAEVEGNVILSDDTTAFESINYIGDIVILSTASGKQLSVTPHHPVLTDRGWIAAAFIHEGDNVISAGIGERASIVINPKKDHIPTRVQDIPVANGMIFAGVPEAAKNLNRDGGRGKVDAVFIDSLLWNSFNSANTQGIINNAFGIRHSPVSFSGVSRFYQHINRLWHTSLSILGVNYSAFPFLLTHGFVPEGIGGRQTQARNIIDFEYSLDNSSSNSNRLSDGVLRFATSVSGNNFVNRKQSDFVPSSSGYFPALDFRTFSSTSKQPMSLEMIRKRLIASVPAFSRDFRAITSEVVFDRVVNIGTRCFSGHVYSLQTQKEWYYSNTIISHNCAMLPWVKGEPNPIEQSGEDWFNSQPESVQKDRMGEGKYNAWRENKFEFNQLSKDYDDDVFGVMKRESTLKELVPSDE